jgi:hypothetical protein
LNANADALAIQNRALYSNVRGERNMPSLEEEAWDLAYWQDSEVTQRLATLQELGIDTAAFEHFFKILIRRVSHLEPPEKLPEGFRGFMQSLGLLSPPPTNEAELQQWRDGLVAKTTDYWRRLLATEDPSKIKDGLERWMHSVSQFDAGLRDSAEAELLLIVAWQKSVEDLAGGVPVLGTALDVLTAVRGETLSGEAVGAFNRLIRLAGVFGPAVLEKLAKRMGRAGTEALEELGELSEQIATKEGQKKAAQLARTTEEEVEKAYENLSHLQPTKKGEAVESLLSDHVKKNLNDVKANFPIVDAESHAGMYVSIADSGRSDRYLVKKLQALFGFGSGASVPKYKSMLASLGELENKGSALTLEEFLKKAQLCVPDDHVEPLRALIRKKVESLGTWPDPEVFQILVKLNGGDPKKAVDFMCNMVIRHSDLR